MKVKLVNQIGYKENLEKYRAGLGGTDLPDVIQVEDTATQQMIDTQSILPAQSCIKADNYDTSRLRRSACSTGTRSTTCCGRCRSTSRTRCSSTTRTRSAPPGLDPEKPPTTLDEVKADAREDQGPPAYEAGFGHEARPVVPRAVVGEGRPALREPGERPEGPGDRRRCSTTRPGCEIFAWMDDMVKSGAAKTNSADGPSQYDNLLGIRSKTVGMTIDSSATLGTISQVLRPGRERRRRARRRADARVRRARAACSSAAARSTS